MAKISKLIEKLEKIKDKHGDLDVVYVSRRNYCMSHDYSDYKLNWITIGNPKIKPVLRLW